MRVASSVGGHGASFLMRDTEAEVQGTVRKRDGKAWSSGQSLVQLAAEPEVVGPAISHAVPACQCQGESQRQCPHR